MPHTTRIHITGGLFHVVSRFHDKRFFFDLKGAREKYLALLGRAAAKHDSRILAYCLMSSHVHLVVQLGNDPLGSIFRSVHSGFGPWLNAARRGSGPVFSGRPKGTLVHAETHGLEVVRYVHNNPVRAGLVTRADESRWSSHRAYLGLDETPKWLDTEALLGFGDPKKGTSKADFARFVDEERSSPRRPELVGELTRPVRDRMTLLMGGEIKGRVPVLGPDDFVSNALRGQAALHRDRFESEVKDWSAKEVVATVFQRLGINVDPANTADRSFDVARARAVAAHLWTDRLGRPQNEMAFALVRSKAAVSTMLSRIRTNGLDDRERGAIESLLNP